MFESLRGLATLLKKAAEAWNRDNVSLLAAALAYYALFSLVPLLIIVIVVANTLLWPGAIDSAIMQEADMLIANGSEGFVGDMVSRASISASTLRLTVVSAFLLIFGASGLFVNIRRAFDIIWGVDNRRGFLSTLLRSYATSFLVINLLGLVLFTFSMVNALLMRAGSYLQESLPVEVHTIPLLSFLASVILLWAVFSLAYKILAGVHLSWESVIPGSLLAALLLSSGNMALEYYVYMTDFGSAFGAGASLVIFLAWIYYSAQIFLFCAEFIKVQQM